ncbi:MAG: hypothetical protein IKL44_05135 [Clostridia bacterium]|nr:hypothetical protein [Clostridia bacterium]MBR3594043.1 hypothetical protein [Clostridia bacterium]
MTTEERIASLEANEKNIFHALDETKQDIRVLQELTKAVQKIADRTDNTAALLEKVDKRLAKIERKPAADFDHYKKAFITAAVTGAAGILFGALFSAIL